MELFDRAAAGGGQLLRAEKLAGAGGAPEAGSAAFLLTFDVGRILVRARGGRLVVEHVERRGDVPQGVVDANEDEPWWRLLGARLLRATDAATADRVRLEFQIADARPRMLALACEGGRLRAVLERGH